MHCSAIRADDPVDKRQRRDQRGEITRWQLDEVFVYRNLVGCIIVTGVPWVVPGPRRPQKKNAGRLGELAAEVYVTFNGPTLCGPPSADVKRDNGPGPYRSFK